MDERRFNWLAVILYALLFLFTFNQVLGTGQMLYAYDQVLGSLQWREFFVESVKRFGSVPYWDPYMFGGMPFFGVLHADNLYPTVLFRFFLPAHVVMNWGFVLHGILAATLAYFFAKNRLRLPKEIAFLVGLSYAFTGSLISLVYAGHDGKFYVLSLLPGLAYLLDKGLETGRVGFFAGAGLVFALMLLSPHAQMTYYAYLTAGVWVLFGLWWTWVDRKSLWQVAKRGLYALLMIAIGLAGAAGIFVPAYYYTQHFSPRIDRGYEYAVSFSLSWADFLGAWFHKFGGYLESYWGPNGLKHNTEYLGAFAGLLGAGFGWLSKKKRYVALFGTLAVLFSLIALGGSTPVYKLFYYGLPGIKKFRAPGMAFAFAAFAFNMLAGLGAEALLDKGLWERHKKKVLAAMGFVVLLAAVAWFVLDNTFKGNMDLIVKALKATPEPQGILAQNYPMIPLGMLRFAVLGLVVYYLLRLERKALPFALGAVIFLDLWSVGKDFIKVIPGPEITYRPDEAIRFLKKDKDIFRVMPAFWHESDNYLMEHGIESVGGHHGLQMKSYIELTCDTLAGVMYHYFTSKNLWAVKTLPAALNAKYAVCPPLPRDARGLPPQIRPAVEALLDTSRWEPVLKGRQVWVLRNKLYLPRFFVVGNYLVSDSPLRDIKGVDLTKTVVLEEDPGVKPTVKAWRTRILDYRPNYIRAQVELDGDGLLVYSGNWYPFWEALVDGKPTKILRADHTLMALPVKAGKHEVVLRWRPTLERASFWAMGLGWLLGLGLLFTLLWRKKEGLPASPED